MRLHVQSDGIPVQGGMNSDQRRKAGTLQLTSCKGKKRIAVGTASSGGSKERPLRLRGAKLCSKRGVKREGERPKKNIKEKMSAAEYPGWSNRVKIP